jgi:surface polysaccharide O-acyltransferase-like enzyme
MMTTFDTNARFGPSGGGALADLSQPGSPRPERQEWMDVLRGGAMLLVLALHATLMVEWHQVEPWPALAELNLVFRPYRMPLLMVLSGLMLDRSLRKGWARYYQGKLDRVVYPLLLWAVITHAIMRHAVMGVDMQLADPRTLFGPYHLWFILFLALFYGVAPLLERFDTLLVVGASLALSWLLPDGSKYGERLFCLMAFFFLGHWLAQRPGLLARLTSGRMALLALPVALALSTYATIAEHHVVYGDPVLFVPVMGGILVLIAAARALPLRGPARPLAFLGRNSLVFYVSHFPLTYLVMGATLQDGLGLPLVALVSLAASLGVGTALVVLSERFALARGLFQRPRLMRVLT